MVSDFVADSGTDLSNYALPTTILGGGTINKAVLSAAIIGNPTKIYDDTTVATLEQRQLPAGRLRGGPGRQRHPDGRGL